MSIVSGCWTAGIRGLAATQRLEPSQTHSGVFDGVCFSDFADSACRHRQIFVIDIAGGKGC